MKKSSLALLLLLTVSHFGFSQVRGYAEISGAISTKTEYVGSLELGIKPINTNLYFGVMGQAFTANQTKDQTTHALVAPKISYAIPVSMKFSIDPFAGGAYQYGGNENYRVSEFGPMFGSKFAFGLKNNGYFFVTPSIVLTSNRLYELGIGFGGIF